MNQALKFPLVSRMFAKSAHTYLFHLTEDGIECSQNTYLRGSLLLKTRGGVQKHIWHFCDLGSRIIPSRHCTTFAQLNQIPGEAGTLVCLPSDSSLSQLWSHSPPHRQQNVSQLDKERNILEFRQIVHLVSEWLFDCICLFMFKTSLFLTNLLISCFVSMTAAGWNGVTSSCSSVSSWSASRESKQGGSSNSPCRRHTSCP